MYVLYRGVPAFHREFFSKNLYQLTFWKTYNNEGSCAKTKCTLTVYTWQICCISHKFIILELKKVFSDYVIPAAAVFKCPSDCVSACTAPSNLQWTTEHLVSLYRLHKQSGYSPLRINMRTRYYSSVTHKRASSHRQNDLSGSFAGFFRERSFYDHGRWGLVIT